MSDFIPHNVYFRESQKLLRRLALAKGHLDLSAGRWAVFSRGNSYRRPLEPVETWLVEALRAKGHLVERPGGGLMTLAMRQATSGKASDYRPSREEGAVPEQNKAESPLAWLRSRKLVSDTQFLAGDRLRADYERSKLERRVTSAWEAGAKGGSADLSGITDSAIAAREKFHHALRSVGPELSSILFQVCCLVTGLEQAERLLDLPQRTGRTVLGLALTALARHYGMLKSCDPNRDAMARWAVPGYRPSITPSVEA